MINLLRYDGQTITANEDRIAFDYAFNGQTGIIKGYAEELGYDISTLNNFKVKTGMAITQGGQVYIETLENVPLQPAIGATVYWYILYFEIDYSSNAATLQTQQYTNRYPEFPYSDDLQVTPHGKAYLPLYRFQQRASGVSNVERVCRILGLAEVNDLPQDDNSNKIANTAHVKQYVKTALDEYRPFYMGNESSNVDYPLGTILFVSSTENAPTIRPNTRIYVTTAPAGNYHSFNTTGTGNLIPGTWVSRGSILIMLGGGSPYPVAIAQRIA